ncbi:MAG: hypothetical protein P8Y45_15625 [Exilibacterium sp.]
MSIYNFPPDSRYYGLENLTLELDDGSRVVYLQRRFVPASSKFAQLQEHVVSEGERLDQIAALHLSDPQAFWRLADANDAMRPEDLTREPGRRLRITLPEGYPATPGGAN